MATKTTTIMEHYHYFSAGGAPIFQTRCQANCQLSLLFVCVSRHFSTNAAQKTQKKSFFCDRQERVGDMYGKVYPKLLQV